jgi:hypothetical protein
MEDMAKTKTRRTPPKDGISEFIRMNAAVVKYLLGFSMHSGKVNAGSGCP